MANMKPAAFANAMRKLTSRQRAMVLLGFCRHLGGCQNDAVQQVDAHSGHCIHRDIYRRPVFRKAPPGEASPSFDDAIRAYEDC